jgi:uncharacterized protein (DUF302 family)
MNQDIREEESLVSVSHVRFTGAKPWLEVCASLVAELGRFDLADYEKKMKEGLPQPAIEARLSEHQGPLGLLLFGSFDHGSLSTLGGSPAQAIQYVLGNPFIAQRMTIHDIRAGLYAPLRLYVYAQSPKATVIEYDLPSSLFGQFGDERIAPVAKSLDEKMKALVTRALAA